MNSNEHKDILNDSAFQSLLVDCLERLERGESLDREAILKEHPEYAPSLEEFLDDQAMLRKVAAEARESIRGASAEAPAGARIEETLDSRSDKSPSEEALSILVRRPSGRNPRSLENELA